MDTTSPIKFEEFKKEERFKRLERHLKLAFVKQMKRVQAGEDKGYNSNSSPTWPSLSTINPDGMDTSCVNGPSLHVSRVESEVVSYSTNLRKMLPGHKIGHIERKPMATSSVKKFPLNESDNDRAIMPPPPANIIFNNRKVIRSDSKQIPEDLQSRKRKTDSETCNSLKKTSLNSSMICDENNINFNKSDSANSKSRVFSRWRVLINEQGQLIIKGTLECGKIARSKPVIQRLTNTKVQSIYKHIYILDGTLVDEREELPEYVRGKFNNGFPDDWENVYQLWRNYIAEGSKVTFRWPTPITDSDDDLNSEITDFTYCRSKQSQSPEHALVASNSNVASSSGYHSRTQSESNQNVDKSNGDKSGTSNIQSTNKKINDSGHSSSKEVSANNIERSVEYSNDSQNLNNSNSNLKNTSYLYEIIREDKVRTILSNLGDRNCPPQYLDKFIELIDCLRYILSYTPGSNDMDNKNPISSPSKKVADGCQRCNNSSFLEGQENGSNQSSKEDSKNKCEKSKDSSKSENCSRNCVQPENQMQTKSTHSDDDIKSNSSDSEAYMGIPHVSLSHLIKNKPKRNQRYRDRKIRKEGKNVDKQNEEQMQPLQNENIEEQYDSSISITEDEYERRLKEKSDKRREKKCSGVLYKKEIDNTPEYAKSADILNNIESLRVNLKSIESKVPTPNKRPHNGNVEKSKPIIKNYEHVHLDVKLKRPLKTQNLPHSDVSILDEISFKNQPKVNPNPTNINNEAKNRDEEEKICENALEHHFLTYDSEDFIDEEEAAKNYAQLTASNSKNKVENTGSKKQDKRSKMETDHTPASERRKGTTKEKTSSNEPFGSKENPKILTSWIPCVVYNDELKKNCNLTFEGKLLNEAGHVLHRKYVTDPIRERHSAKLIETVNNEFFTLVGDLSDTKHVVPKELLRQCRTGCPTKIKEFCEEWKILRPVVEKEGANKINLHNASIDQFAVPTSSRGRKILPPLNYWEGERLLSKNDDVFYTPGHTTESSQVGQSSTAKKTLLSEQRSQSNNKKEISSRVSKSTTKPSNAADDLINLEPKPRQLKKRIAQKLKYSSSDSETSEPTNKKAFRKPLNPRKASETQGNLRTQPGEIEILTESAYNAKLQKQQKTDKGNSQKNTDPLDKKLRVPAKKSSGALTWTYDKGQYQDNMLSDDQSSVYIQ